MESHVGVDWARGSWVVVEATTETTNISAEPSLLNVWHEYRDQAHEILVDIPVHLRSKGDRECDQEAKDFLGSRGSTVFWTPNSDAVAARDYDEAVTKNTRGLGSHSWGLTPRIREVNALLDEFDAARETVYESHPEVCFKAYHGDDLPSKKTDEGLEVRTDCLIKHGGESFQPVLDLVDERRTNSQWHHRIQSGRVNDVFDAAILALTARESNGTYSTIPADADPTRDPSIVYPDT
jgi:predicted RNase H-like nuclease